MALPSKKQQVAAVAKFLDSDRNEGRSLEEIATDIVNGYLDALTPPSPPPPLREGMLLKTILANKVHRVAWISGERVWVVPETGGYGWLGSLDSELWSMVEEYRPAKMVETGELTATGKPRKVRIEMTDDEISQAWANPDWSTGEIVSRSQRGATFEIIATGPQFVLMRNVRTGALCADSNGNLSKHYKREVKGGDEW